MKSFLLAVICIGFLASSAWAQCDCALHTPDQWFDAADVIFIGTLVQSGVDDGQGGAIAHFKVVQPLKEEVTGEVNVSYDTKGRRALSFKKGEGYLVYAIGDVKKQDLRTDRCCGTKTEDSADEDLHIHSMQTKPDYGAN